MRFMLLGAEEKPETDLKSPSEGTNLSRDTADWVRCYVDNAGIHTNTGNTNSIPVKVSPTLVRCYQPGP